MKTRIPLSAIDLGEAEGRLVQEVLNTTMISSAGPMVTAFEAALAAHLEVAHVVATASGSCALELALRALGIGPGDEVIVPALTFAAPISAVVVVGAVPVIVDVCPETWTIDPGQVARHIGPRTRAIIAVDLLGHPADYDALADFAVPIVEDAAEAVGARYKGRAAGSLGTLAIMSFHANKAITTGEGGCVATDDADLAARVRQLSNFGMSPARRYWHETAGHNYRMTALAAAVGVGQTQRWADLIGARAQVTRWYDEVLAGLDVVRRPVAPWAQESTWLYTIASHRRTEILAACAARGIDARAIWPVVTEQPAFRDFATAACPVARAISESALWLPTASAMSRADVEAVSDGVLAGFESTVAA